MSKKFFLFLFSLFFVISLSYLFFAFAFTEPTVNPPGNNVPAPINVSATTQTKQGGLNVAINSGTYLGIGTTTPDFKLTVMDGATLGNIKGILNAGYISAGQFGQYTGGGIFSFPGNVGIGTTTPGQKLEVNGNILSTGGIFSYGGSYSTVNIINYEYDGLFAADKKWNVTLQGFDSSANIFDARPETFVSCSSLPCSVTINFVAPENYWYAFSLSFPWGTNYAGSSSFLIEKFVNNIFSPFCVSISGTWQTVADVTNFSGYRYLTTSNLGDRICKFRITFRNITGSQNRIDLGEIAAYRFYHGNEGPLVKRYGDTMYGTLNISSGNLQVSSPAIIEISGTNPTCPSGYQTISKYWQSKTCNHNCDKGSCCGGCAPVGCGTPPIACTNCTTPSGWFNYAPTCNYTRTNYTYCTGSVMPNCVYDTCQADTWTKVRCLEIGTGNLYVGGNVGIGTTSPSVRLHVYENLFEKSGVLFNIAETNPSYYILDVQSGGTSKLYVRADGNVGIGTTAPNYKLDVSGAIRQINAKGCDLYADANGMLICQPSSLKYKTNIKDLDFDINKFLSLTPRSFDWKITTAPFTPAEKGSVGFIAEEVDKKFPDLVRYKDNQPEGVKYEILPVYLFKVVKDLINNFTDKVKSSLNDLDIKIENNIVRFTQIFSQKITTEEIDTQNLNTQELCVQNENGEKLCLNKEELKELINLIKKQKEK